jgi:hypothetical protein
MASTPIYNWPTPDNTDLVKNGALAIRTLGDAIDTTVDTMIPETIFAAKGDLLGASANDTPAVLTVGANGETLVADSSTSTGLRYTAGNPIPNPVLNSTMQIAQRGTTFTFSGSTAYTFDRWQGRTGAGAQTISRQVTNDTTNLPFIQFCARVGRDASNAGIGIILFEQSMETINTIPFVGKTVTISYYARKGADFSGASSILSGALVTGTGTDQNVNAYTGGANTILGSSTLTTTWQRFSYTGAIPTTVKEMAMQFSYTPVGTAGAADYFEITGVQVDIGSVALPFRTYAGTIQGELAACQRYFQTVRGFSGIASGSTAINSSFQFPVCMRTSPSVAASSTLQISDAVTTDFAQSSANVSITNSNRVTNEAIMVNMGNFTGLTSYRIYNCIIKASDTGAIQLNAEL